MLGGGCIVNDWSAFVGMSSTSTEISVIESVFKLNQAQPSNVTNSLRASLIESYVILFLFHFVHSLSFICLTQYIFYSFQDVVNWRMDQDQSILCFHCLKYYIVYVAFPFTSKNKIDGFLESSKTVCRS